MDSTTIQTLVTLGSFLVLGTIYIVNGRIAGKVLGTKLEMIDGTIEDFKIEMKKLTEIVIGQALQDERIKNIETREILEGKRIDTLEARLNRYLDKIAFTQMDKVSD